MSMFKKAERKKSKLRLALCGVSGSGKTLGALMIAYGIGGKLAVIDTENGSAALYSKKYPFMGIELSPPFSPARYIEAIKNAEKEGYEILIIDSLSHAWFAEGGVLDIVDKTTKSSSSKNSYIAWKEGTPEQNKLVEAIIRSGMHIIVTMRSKESRDIVENNGKKTVVKMGLDPIQRGGISYEFTTVLDISVDGHIATSSKDRTGIFDGQHFLIEENTGKNLLDWLNEGIDITDDWINQIKSCKSLEQLKHVFSNAQKSNKDLNFIEDIVREKDSKKKQLEDQLKTTSLEMFGGIDEGVHNASV